MTDLNDFIYTDGVHDVLATYVNRLLAATMRSEYKNIETLSADRELTDADTPIQRFDCNGANRVLTMPVADAVNNHPFWIVNASDGGETLTVKSNSGTLVYAVLNNGNAVYLLPNGAGGYSPVGLSNNGWLPASGTWSYSSEDSPIFVVNVPDLDAAEINVGDRIMLTQTTVKYFIVHAKGSPSGGFTPITIYGGTDYTLANAAIAAPYWSHTKSPLGFPLDPDKWSLVVTDTANRTKTGPNAFEYYSSVDSGSLPSITIPIGAWNVFWSGVIRPEKVSTTTINQTTTLSTSTSSASDNDFTMFNTFQLPSGNLIVTMRVVSPTKTLKLSSETTYYLIMQSGQSSMGSIAVRGDVGTTIIKATSAYL